jgi:SAM-dependent methyltransferase
MELAARACPVCQSSDGARVLAEANVDEKHLDAYAFASRKMPEYMHHRLIVCPACDLVYASPIPRAGALSAAYREAAFDSGEEARFASRTYAGFVRAIRPRLPDLVGALDIGTGDGAFLNELLAAGFTAVPGVEPSAAPIAAASPSTRRLIRHDLFRPEAFPPDSFSLITCFQTIEHLPDPLGMAQAAHRLLKDGGAALFIGHNRRALSARLLGRKSPIFDIEHLQLFSPRSARQLLERAGFVDVDLRVVLNRYPLHYWLKLLPLPTARKRTLIRWLKLRRLGHVPIALPAGNLAVIGYKRCSPVT